MTEKYAIETMHEPFFSNSVSMQDQTCDCMSPMSMHDLKSKCISPMIMHGNHLVNNSKHTQQEKYMQKTVLPRSWQDYPTARTQDVTPTNVGPP